MREAVPPILNDKFVHIVTKLDETIVVPCVAYASPPPIYRYIYLSYIVTLIELMLYEQVQSACRQPHPPTILSATQGVCL